MNKNLKIQLAQIPFARNQPQGWRKADPGRRGSPTRPERCNLIFC